jgi:hypothetical protein
VIARATVVQGNIQEGGKAL